MHITELSQNCQTYAEKTVAFVKRTVNCSAVILTWHDCEAKRPPHIQLGTDESMISDYYENFNYYDPLRFQLLIKNSSRFETLSNSEKHHNVDLVREYRTFTEKYRIHDEIDLVLWAGGAPVASLAVLYQEVNRQADDEPKLKELGHYLQYTFSILPAVRQIDLNRELESKWKLTPKERAVANLMILGESNKSIASLLDMELPTVKTHILHIFQKLTVDNRCKAICLLTGTRKLSGCDR